MIYADYNGSAPMLKSVREYLKSRIDSDLYANPNAIHSFGQKINTGMEKCREMIAAIVGCHSDQLYFNSGASEGISHILFSVLEYLPANKKVIITSPIEHAVIPKALEFYRSKRGFIIKTVKISSEGVVDLDNLKEILETHQNELALVSIMAVNNETGVIQPYEEIAKLAHEFKSDYFCDTTQLIGKGEFHFEKSGIDFAVCSGHKIGALTGTGFVMAKEPTKLHSHVFGSVQEKGLRGGTQNYIGIETLAVAMKDFEENKKKLKDLNSSRLDFENYLKNKFTELRIIGDKAQRLAGTTLLSYPGIHGQAIQIELESHDIFVTTSAACMDNQPETSVVLKAMGIQDDVGRGVIRISLSWNQGKKEYEAMASAISSAINKLNKIHSY